MGDVPPGEDSPRYNSMETAVRDIFKVIEADRIARKSVELNIVRFGGDVDSSGFRTIDNVDEPDLSPNGGTPLAEGVNRGLDETDDRLVELNDEGTPVNVSSLFLFTDGQPTEDESYVRRAAERVNQAVKSGNLFFSAFVVCDDDMRCLKKYGFPNVSLMPASYREFVLMVSSSIKASSRGQKAETFGA